MQLPTITVSALVAILGASPVTLAAPTYNSNSNSNYNTNTNTVNNGSPSSSTPSLITARLQFELERQTTFIQRPIPVPGRLNLNTSVLTARIVSVTDATNGASVNNLSASCQAYDILGNALGGPILSAGEDTELNAGELAAVAFVECVQA